MAFFCVSKKSTRFWSRMPLARKLKISGLYSLLLRYPKKISAWSADFLRPRRRCGLFFSAVGGNRPQSSANTNHSALEKPLNERFFAHKEFFALVSGKTKCGHRWKNSHRYIAFACLYTFFLIVIFNPRTCLF